MKKNAFVVQNLQPTPYEPRIYKLLRGDLPLPQARPKIGTESYLSCGHIIISGYFHRFYFVSVLPDLNNLIKVTWIMANPLTRQHDFRSC